MVLTSLIGKIHLPPQIRSYGWVYCDKSEWVHDELCPCDGVVLPWISLVLLEFHEDSKLKEYSLVRKLDENYHCITKLM